MKPQVKGSSRKFRQLARRLFHVFRYIVSLDVCRTGDKEQFLVLRSCRFAVTLFGHIERVGNASCNHQQRLIDKIHTLARVESHKFHKAALGVAEGGVGMCVALEIISVAVAVKVER